MATGCGSGRTPPRRPNEALKRTARALTRASARRATNVVCNSMSRKIGLDDRLLSMLRAVNVGGTSRIKMDALRAVYESIGLRTCARCYRAAT